MKYISIRVLKCCQKGRMFSIKNSPQIMGWTLTCKLGRASPRLWPNPFQFWEEFLVTGLSKLWGIKMVDLEFWNALKTLPTSWSNITKGEGILTCHITRKERKQMSNEAFGKENFLNKNHSLKGVKYWWLCLPPTLTHSPINTTFWSHNRGTYTTLSQATHFVQALNTHPSSHFLVCLSFLPIFPLLFFV